MKEISRPKKAIFITIAIFFLLSTIFIFGEMACRIILDSSIRPPYFYNKTPRFTNHHFLTYSGLKNDSREFHWNHETLGDCKAIYKTNKLGFLGDDFIYKKELNEIRILTFGGSTTWAMGINLETKTGTMDNTWPKILETKLKVAFPEKKITVYNLAQDAYCSPMSVINMAFVGFDLKPDYVISYDAINDMMFTFDYKSETDYSGIFKQYSGYQTIAHKFPRFLYHSYFFSFLIDQADHLLRLNHKAPWDDVYTQRRNVTENSWSSKTLKNIELLYRNFRLLKAMSHESGSEFIATTAHYYKPDSIQKLFNDSLRGFFSHENIIFFDADKSMPKEDNSINTDFVHFTDKGTEKMAEGYFQIIQPLINKSLHEKENCN